jgi:hypothetical protein
VAMRAEITAEATVGREGRSGAASAAAGAAGYSTVRKAYKTDLSLDLWTVNSFIFFFNEEKKVKIKFGEKIFMERSRDIGCHEF